METKRVVITGTFGSGKTTFVQTASEIEVVSIERPITDEKSAQKETTTVALDFGRIVLDSNLDLHLYGTPGQDRFDFMWEILVHGASAYIVLVAANQPNSLEQARQIITFMSQQAQVPMMIGLTHMDSSEALTPEEIMLGLGYEENFPSFIIVNPRDKASTVEALFTLKNLLTSGTN
ncbi:MAG: ATP/GTP-binding protein [Coleofasciculaceae cyanobacterium]